MTDIIASLVSNSTSRISLRERTSVEGNTPIGYIHPSTQVFYATAKTICPSDGAFGAGSKALDEWYYVEADVMLYNTTKIEKRSGWAAAIHAGKRLCTVTPVGGAPTPEPEPTPEPAPLPNFITGGVGMNAKGDNPQIAEVKIEVPDGMPIEIYVNGNKITWSL